MPGPSLGVLRLPLPPQSMTMGMGGLAGPRRPQALADVAMGKEDVKARLAPVPVYTVANPKNEFVLVAGEVRRGHGMGSTTLLGCRRHERGCMLACLVGVRGVHGQRSGGLCCVTAAAACPGPGGVQHAAYSSWRLLGAMGGTVRLAAVKALTQHVDPMMEGPPLPLCT